jgi:DNA repair photolyase
VALGINTDAWQPVERRLRVTRGILDVLAEARHPVTIVTKSALILRDLDLLAEMARGNLAHVAVSITTLDPALARTLEPRAPSPQRRLSVIPRWRRRASRPR